MDRLATTSNPSNSVTLDQDVENARYVVSVNDFELGTFFHREDAVAFYQTKIAQLGVVPTA